MLSRYKLLGRVELDQAIAWLQSHFFLGLNSDCLEFGFTKNQLSLISGLESYPSQNQANFYKYFQTKLLKMAIIFLFLYIDLK